MLYGAVLGFVLLVMRFVTPDTELVTPGNKTDPLDAPTTTVIVTDTLTVLFVLQIILMGVLGQKKGSQTPSPTWLALYYATVFNAVFIELNVFLQNRVMENGFNQSFDQWVTKEHARSYLRPVNSTSGLEHFHGAGTYSVRHLAYPQHEVEIGQMNPVVLRA